MTKNAQNFAKKPALYQVMLANVIASIFGCEVILGYHDNMKRAVCFVGVEQNTEIASYAFDMLFRQLKTARQAYIKNELSRVRLAKNKTARADAFCIGFVSQIKDLTASLVVNNPHKELIKSFVQERTKGRIASVNKGSINTKTVKIDDYLHGVSAGKNAQLHNAVYGQTAPLAIGGGT